MKEIKTVLFRTKSSGRENHETNDMLEQKFKDYKDILVKDGYKIIEEKEVKTRRGIFVEITYE